MRWADLPFHVMMTALAPQRRANRFSVLRVVVFVLALGVLVYLGDFVFYALRARFPQLGPANGSVHRIRVLAIPEKNNKVEYQIDSVQPEEDVSCAHSLFTHGSNRPCWYVTRHANDPITM